MDTLQAILGEDETRAEATIDGVTMLIEQYINPFDKRLFWIWGDKSKYSDGDGTDITYDQDYMAEELFDSGFDPDALIWQRVVE